MIDYPMGTVTFVFTDVVESSRLWEEHHEAMRVAIAAHDEIVQNSIAANAGVLIKQTGDGAFAVFASALDAIAAAMSIQDELADQSWGSISNLDVRIGVHTGEAELRDGDYFGPTVNRAARVMSTATGGEVHLSLTTQEVVRDRLPPGLVLRDLGERDLRGLSRPEHVFELAPTGERTGGLADRVAESSTADADDERARRAVWIAVLPFVNMSGDPQQEYFADGISEDVITGLAAFRSLRVISRTSSFRYKGSGASIPAIAAELGARFVLEGSVRRAGSRVRVTAQLIEAAGGHHVWADRYDGELVDIFDVQDQITRSIVVAIDPAIRVAEAERVSRTRPDSLDAWDYVQRGISEYSKYRKDANAEARSHFNTAVKLDPDYAEAHAGLAWTHFLDGWLHWVDDTTASIGLGYEEAKHAIELDSHDAASHASMAWVNYAMGRLDAAQRSAERAIELNPSFPMAHLVGGVAKIHGGDPEGGLPMVSRAIALSPHDPGANWFFGGRAIGHFLLGEHEEAVADARAAIKVRYGYLFGRVVLTASLVEMGNLEEAREELEAILDISPNFTRAMLDPYTFSNEADRERLVAGLRAAGLES